MTIGDEKFFAWLDGELGGEEAAMVEARVAADPALSDLARKHRALEGRLREAFATVADAPVPDRIRTAVPVPSSDVHDLAARRQERRPRAWPALPQWAAMAASLVLGLSLGILIKQPASAPIQIANGAIYASASLNEALNTQLASAPSATGTHVGLTFRNHDGAICRSFADGRASGLACRDGGRWRVRGLFGAPEGQSGEYRMAAGTDPNLASLIDSAIAGEPFDAAQERAARQRGWR